MSLFVDAFKATLLGGGARPNLFRVIVPFPVASGASAGTTLRNSFLCKAAQLPASSIGNIEVPFRGRTINLAGDRTFESWTITVINDVDFSIRDGFEQWMNFINTHATNTGIATPISYKQDLEVIQLDKSGAPLKSYTFRGAYPTSVAAIDLSYDTTDSIEEFTVEFQIDYWTSNTTN
jgi:hypothetical protein